MYVSEVRSSRRPLWLWPNLLSLDAPLIAVLWLQLFAVSLHVQLEAAVSLALALVVWLIYVGDRLADGWNANLRAALTARHRFHRLHRRSLSTAASMGSALGIWACLHLDGATFMPDWRCRWPLRPISSQCIRCDFGFQRKPSLLSCSPSVRSFPYRFEVPSQLPR